ncbi:hypothetical protein L249_4696 [Ophiocordyceps polyrhachis-furcata BCC 54312]|uniref:BPL/LPL catalytic domain-containing protein n=1 Tax=Ophiocordyceps polyrhachis-furcata BCC 54312 TaxID=1330021 RepID=A0A367L2D8_9HYPO|nr:hypothetical protein L249_4696 [Ophiocordyceps polyrhachis-furcata BCC 54312]
MPRHVVARTSLRPQLRPLVSIKPRARRLSLLTHRHLVDNDDDDDQGLVSYDFAQGVQEEHRRHLLAWKAQPDHAKPPGPLLLSFESKPTFTLGRRQHLLAEDEAARLLQPLHVISGSVRAFTPVVAKTGRGGLTTYHGPGQVVLWPVVDLRSPLYPAYGVADYADHLQNATRRLLENVFGIRTMTVPDEPGVWVSADEAGPRRKIAAVGVHHRRYVAALGVAVNVHVCVSGHENLNPWARFVPCGLEDRLVTSVAAEMGHRAPGEWDLASLARRWAAIFEEGLLDKGRRVYPDPRPCQDVRVPLPIGFVVSYLDVGFIACETPSDRRERRFPSSARGVRNVDWH